MYSKITHLGSQLDKKLDRRDNNLLVLASLAVLILAKAQLQDSTVCLSKQLTGVASMYERMLVLLAHTCPTMCCSMPVGPFVAKK